MTSRFTSSAWRWIKGTPDGDTKPNPRALEDLARRKAMGPRADLTGRLLGDPPPGRSALEKKLEAERKRAAAAMSTETPQREEDEA